MVGGTERNERARRGQQRGFGFAGVLAATALVALSLPMLLRSMLDARRAMADAARYELAVMHVSSMAAALRASPGAWSGRALSFTVPEHTVPGGGGADSLRVDCGRERCSPEQIAVYDVTRWGQALHDSLPGATGTVGCAVAGRCRVAVRWVAAGGPREVALDVVLRWVALSGERA